MTDLRNETHTCSRCGASLSVVTIQVPIYTEIQFLGELRPDEILAGYEDQDVVSECPRCTGGY